MWKPLVSLALILGLAGPVGAVEYRLQVANLYRESFVHYFDGPLGSGSPIEAGAIFSLRRRGGPEPGGRLSGLGGCAILDFSSILWTY